ncbi:MAG TPA: TIGR00730 family Rossman fold protein [Terracidiphilus sp.]|nr:TIGR00730 family Rossman fold protein [Terracidiphilus sp.]
MRDQRPWDCLIGLPKMKDGGRYAELIMDLSNRAAQRVAVYCGSANGSDPAFLNEARALGNAIAAAGLGLVYGGASVGLMGAVADAALDAGAEVIGVLPEILAGSEIAHKGLTRLEVVATMHERKALMVKLADAFLMLPGGYGTLDEMMEIVTWKQLRLHGKPCVLINTAGYWDGLLAFLDTSVKAGFLKAENRRLLEVAGGPAEAVEMVIRSQH